MLLASDELARLLKLLGMLGSEHSGERAAAALKAHQFVTSRELTWAELLDPADAPLPIVSVGVADNVHAGPPYSWTSGPTYQTSRPQNPNSYAPNPPPPPPQYNIIPPTNQWPKHLLSDVDNLLRHGRRLEAIREVRIVFNASLTDAKDIIDVLASQIRINPVSPASPFMQQAAAAGLRAASNSKVNLPTWQDCVRHMRNPVNAAFVRGQKEETFLFDLSNRADHIPLTHRQTSWLSDICARAGITWHGNPQNIIDPL